MLGRVLWLLTNRIQEVVFNPLLLSRLRYLCLVEPTLQLNTNQLARFGQANYVRPAIKGCWWYRPFPRSLPVLNYIPFKDWLIWELRKRLHKATKNLFFILHRTHKDLTH